MSEHQQVYHDDNLDDDDSKSSPSVAAVSTRNSPSPFVNPDRKRPRIDDFCVPVVLPGGKRPSGASDGSRKLFQRLWSDKDEVELLRGFLEYTTQRGLNNSSHQHRYDRTAFYDQIKSKFKLNFNKNQLVEKLQRLKKKYRTVISKMETSKEFVFKSPHEQVTFEISRKIWSNGGSIGFSAPMEDDGLDDEDAHSNPNPNSDAIIICNNSNPHVPMPTTNLNPVAVVAAPDPAKVAASVPSLIEETVKNCAPPIFKELLNRPARGFGFGGMGMSPIPLWFEVGAMNMEMMGDEKWRKQQMLELEVYSKRLELVQDQVKAQLEELRSMGR